MPGSNGDSNRGTRCPAHGPHEHLATLHQDLGTWHLPGLKAEGRTGLTSNTPSSSSKHTLGWTARRFRGPTGAGWVIAVGWDTATRAAAWSRAA